MSPEASSIPPELKVPRPLPPQDTTTPPELPPEYWRGEQYYQNLGIAYSEGSCVNSHGKKLFTTTWRPLDGEPKALVFLCHGYGVDCSTYFHDTASALARGGYEVLGLDYEGYGQSEGLRGMTNSVDDMVQDCILYYSTIRDAPENRGKRKFLCGESLGGAVALKIVLREPEAWDGAILLAPMCKISDKFKPPDVVVFALRWLARVFPQWAVVPTADLLYQAVEDPDKRPYFKYHPIHYHGPPRLQSAVSFLEATEELAGKLEEVTIPFLVLHGDADTVTEPAVSQALFEKSLSKDKTFKLYPGMWHSLIQGAKPHNAKTVLEDVVGWIDVRCTSAAPEEDLRDET